jgi:hypothetical protein
MPIRKPLTDPIVGTLKALGVLFANPPPGSTDIAGISFNDAGFPIGVQNAAGVSNDFPSPDGQAFPNRTPGVARWNAARNAALISPLHLFVGDSNVAGEGSGGGVLGLDAAALTGMANQFATLAGHRCDALYGDQNTFTGTIPPAQYDPGRISLGAGWVVDPGGITILGGRYYSAPAASAGALSFASATPCDTMDLRYIQTVGANTAAVVRIDGNIVDTIDQTGANAWALKTYTGLALGVHTLTVTPGATGVCRVTSVEPRVAASVQPRTIKGGICSGAAADMNLATNPWSNRNAAVALAPKFTTYYATINNLVAGTVVDTYRTAVDGFVAALNAAGSDGCLVMGFPSTGAGTTNGLADSYANALRGVAQDYGWGYFDGRNPLGSSNVGATYKGLRFDNNHPNLAGHVAFATAYYNWLRDKGFL